MDLAGIAWRKSSFSANGSNCVEVGVWTKSSYSANGSNCVEVGADDGAPGERYLLRDSKNPTGPVLAFSPDAWGSFQHAVRH